MRTQKRGATPKAKYVCPTCDQPVSTVAERHKTMGVFFPIWVAGPCHNPQCADFVPRWMHTDPRPPAERHAAARRPAAEHKTDAPERREPNDH